MSIARRLLTCLVTLATVVVGSGVPAFAEQPPSDSVCNYSRCALGIVPAWNGLVVTRGARHEPVANLGFFWTRSLETVFGGSDSARSYARRAVRVRRVAAVLTDAGAVALGYAVVRRAGNGSLSATDRAVAIVGASAFGVSVPLQFVADGLLSRAIWWKNRDYADTAGPLNAPATTRARSSMRNGF